MENLVVGTFKNAQDATNGLNKLKELDQLGDITIYNMAMIRKTSEDHFELLHHDGPDTSNMPAQGAIAGTLIGAIGGPIGMALGMLTGVMAGAIDEDDSEDISEEFLDKVNKKLTVGTFAILMDVEEDSDIMINTSLEPFNGTTVHTNIADQYDKYDQEQWDELNKEIDDAEQEMKRARDEDKAAIKAKIEKLKSERKEKIKDIKARATKTKEHLQGKIIAMDQKLKTSNEKLKGRIEAHREKLHEKLEKFNEDVAWAFD